MGTLAISPKFQVVIPKFVRETPKLAPGQKVRAMIYQGRIELIPVRPMNRVRGFLKSIDTDVTGKMNRV